MDFLANLLKANKPETYENSPLDPIGGAAMLPVEVPSVQVPVAAKPQPKPMVIPAPETQVTDDSQTTADLIKSIDQIGADDPNYQSVMGKSVEDEVNEAARDSGIDLSVSPEAMDQATGGVKPLSQADILEAYRRLKPAQQNYQNDLNNYAMLQGANQIAQGFARGYGADIGDGSKSIDALRAASKEGVDSVGRQISGAQDAMKASKAVMDYEEAGKMNDPASDVSKLYREQAYSVLKKLNPESPLIGQLDNMSAAQLQKLPGFKSMFGGDRPNTRYVTTQEPDGTVRSKLIDMTNGETIKDLGLAGYAYGTMIDPRTKEVMRLSKSDPTQGPSLVTGPSNVRTTDASGQVKDRNPYEVKSALNSYERDQLDKDVSEFQKEIKDEKRIISEIGAISDSTVELAKKNPNAAKTLGAQIAKIMQGSRLTDADVVLYTGQSGILNQMEDFVNDAVLGKISDDKANNIRGVLSAYNAALRKSLDNRARQAATINLQNYNPELGLKASEVAPLYYISDKEVNGTKKTSPDVVKMKSPDGRILGIPKANVEAAKKRGLVEVKE